MSLTNIFDRSSSFPAWPFYEQDEIDAAKRVLETGRVNYWTGEEGRLFEEEFATQTDCKYAVAVSNGTAALELALYSLGIGPGDEVIVPCRTYIASASCVVRCDATPVMADIDLNSQNITAETIEAVLTSKTKAIIAVHLAGWPCDMDAIMELARDHDLKVIEDCAQAHGAKYKGQPVGSLGDVAAFSFCQDKIISTGGEGGMLTTNSDDIWERAWSYRDHGNKYELPHQQNNTSTFRWLRDSFGTNWRLTEMQSAIGRVQLRKLADWVEIRRKHAAILNNYFSNIPALRVTIPAENCEHSYYKYYFFIRPEFLKPEWDRDQIINEIRKEGIPCHYGSCSEIYLEKAFVNNDLTQSERLPFAKELGETSLALLVHPTITEEEIHNTYKVVDRAISRAVIATSEFDDGFISGMQ